MLALYTSENFRKMIINYYIYLLQIEDLSQQAQVAAAEKFKEPPVISAAEAGGSAAVSLITTGVSSSFV